MNSEQKKQENSQPLEIERKFLIAYPDLSWLEAQSGSQRVEIVQTYLLPDGEFSRRVRMWREPGRTIYYKTSKRSITGRTRLELEEEIRQETYLTLLQEADPARHPVEKVRWCLPYAGHVLEIDLYPFWDRHAILECELESEEEEICFPPELTILREVTEDRQFLNSSLAGNLHPELLVLSV